MWHSQAELLPRCWQGNRGSGTCDLLHATVQAVLATLVYPAHRRIGVVPLWTAGDRGCPVGTRLARPMWHSSGTAGQGDLAQAWDGYQLGRWGRPRSPDALLPRWQCLRARQLMTCKPQSTRPCLLSGADQRVSRLSRHRRSERLAVNLGPTWSLRPLTAAWRSRVG
jgi:hypothetical protein